MLSLNFAMVYCHDYSTTILINYMCKHYSLDKSIGVLSIILSETLLIDIGTQVEAQQ